VAAAADGPVDHPHAGSERETGEALSKKNRPVMKRTGQDDSPAALPTASAAGKKGVPRSP
jgi:hypothetical protein